MQKQKPSTLNILDCTFRDGGYYTNWTFHDELVADYLSTMAELPIKAIELGYAGKGLHAGKFANLDNEKVKDLRVSPNVMLAVMLDAKDFFGFDEALDAKIDSVLGPKIDGGIDSVRVAVHFRDAWKCARLIAALHDRDYGVFLNLMQIDLADPVEIGNCLDFVNSAEDLQAVYVADSLGSMQSDRVRQLAAKFTGECEMQLGFHAHDNCGLAIANALCAEQAGATWLDCTVAGMGRGAGNACTEQLLRAVSVPECSRSAKDRLQWLVVQHFNPLRTKHGWGDNLFYQVGAANGLHPTFVQEVLGDPALSGEQMLRWINNIPADTPKFDREILERAKEPELSGQAPIDAEMGKVA